MEIVIYYSKLAGGKIKATLKVVRAEFYPACNIFSGSHDWPSEKLYALDTSRENYISGIFDSPEEAKSWAACQMYALEALYNAWCAIDTPPEERYTL
jgi:hypothetical protein